MCACSSFSITGSFLDAFSLSTSEMWIPNASLQMLVLASKLTITTLFSNKRKFSNIHNFSTKFAHLHLYDNWIIFYNQMIVDLYWSRIRFAKAFCNVKQRVQTPELKKNMSSDCVPKERTWISSNNKWYSNKEHVFKRVKTNKQNNTNPKKFPKNSYLSKSRCK
jgi:hypothetical protein